MSRKICPVCKKKVSPDFPAEHIFHVVSKGLQGKL